jgi:hypothetical protein
MQISWKENGRKGEILLFGLQNAINRVFTFRPSWLKLKFIGESQTRRER